jgi:A/G-specific adenine glycosylase
MEKDPYKILISEVMLQRTRADQVLPVYQDFIQRFPDIRTLCSADSDEISKFISRLGLFWRTKLIVKMAEFLSKNYNDKIPSDRLQLLAIPGVGEYVADALLVFAFSKKRTVIDSNVVRVVSRYFGIPLQSEMRRKATFIRFCQSLADDLHSDKIREFNWGLLDHSATVCMPRPRCQKCPLAKRCNYYIDTLNR